MLDIIVISGLAGLATGVGAGLVLLFGRPSTKLLSLMLGFAAGIMLSIATLELLPEAVEIGGLTNTIIGFLIGVSLMYGLDLYVPHLNVIRCEDNDKEKQKSQYECLQLFVLTH